MDLPGRGIVTFGEILVIARRLTPNFGICPDSVEA
jgi:hypothetical protein